MKWLQRRQQGASSAIGADLFANYSLSGGTQAARVGATAGRAGAAEAEEAA